MKCVILAGGLGSRLGEETSLRPKPMVEIGGRPILWHIMKHYSFYGISDFIICLGYKGYVIKEYFANYLLHNSDVTIDIKTGSIAYHTNRAEPWRVTLVDTGESTMTGGRLRRVRAMLPPDQAFCMTYGDGLSNVNLTEEIAFHHRLGLKATVACVRPPARFGSLVSKGDQVVQFEEKPQISEGLINGGFFVLQPSVTDLIEDDSTVWEREPMERLAREGQLAAWQHNGFWQPMDTVRDRDLLNRLWREEKADWKVW